MKFMSSLPTTQVECELPAFAAQTNVRDLERIFLEKIRKVVDFEGCDGGALTARFESGYHLEQKLSGQDLSEAIDLNDYLKCKSQLEYVVKLRRAMQKPASA